MANELQQLLIGLQTTAYYITISMLIIAGWVVCSNYNSFQ